MPTLYTSLLSANGRKALAVALQLRLKLCVQEVDVYHGAGNTPEYRRINPWGKIPSLSDKGRHLWESNAIIIYLAEQYSDFQLFSRHVDKRADILRWLFWEAAHWQPTLSRIIKDRVAQVLFDGDSQVEPECNWEDPEIVSLLNELQHQLSSRDFICGDSLTLADFSLAAMTTYFHACRFPEQTYPAIKTWLTRMNNIDAWKTTLHVKWR